MLFKVIRYSLDKDILTEMTAEHTNHRTAFQIANVIEDLIHFKGIFHGNFNRVGGA